jgi:hypothetical protein
MSKLEGLGWIEYFFKVSENRIWERWQPSTEVNGLNLVYYYFITIIYCNKLKLI